MASSDHLIDNVTIFPLQQQNQRDDLEAVEEEFDNETEYESDEEEEEDDEDLNSNSSADPHAAVSTVTVAVPPPPPPSQPPIINFIDSSELKRQRIESSSLLQPQVPLPQIAAAQAHVITVASATIAAVDHVYDQQQPRKQLQQPADEARKLFQRLWTDEDEIELLQGFYEYTSQRGINNNNVHHHNDITLFYDQIKSKLQLEFNRNQLVEKLRRLKKKYRNNVARIGSGKEFVFKIPHDFATFNISRKIWGEPSSGSASGGGGATFNVVAATATGALGFDGGIDDEDLNHKHGISVTNNNHHTSNDMMMFDLNNNTDKKACAGVNVTPPRSRKRPISSSPRVAKVEEKTGGIDEKCIVTPISSSIHGIIEETIKSCLSPLLKEILSSTKNGDARGSMLSPIPLSFGGSSSSIGNSLLGGEVVEEKWRKQQILELEVYSQRLDLVQDQIKATLEELRSAGSS